MTTLRYQYRVVNPADFTDLSNQLNNLFSQVGNRLDQMEGWRGTPAFQSDIDLGGNKGVNAGVATETSDLTQLGQVTDDLADVLTRNKPVGTIHITTDPANPFSYLAYGTWELFGSGTSILNFVPTDAGYNKTIYVYHRIA